MAVQQSQVLPAQFVQDLGQDLAKQVTTTKIHFLESICMHFWQRNCFPFPPKMAKNGKE